MHMIRSALAGLLALLTASSAVAQTFPTVPGQSVIGRLGIAGVSGPSQAIPITTFLSRLGGTPAANTVWAGPTSGGAAAPTFRALVGADLPNPGASSKGGVQSLTCSSSNWLNALSTGGVLACSQPNFTDLAGSISAAQIPAGTIVNAAISASAAIALSKLATQAANTAVANVTSGAAAPTAAALPSCSTATSALSYTSGTGFGCQTFGTVVAQAYNQGSWTPAISPASGGPITYTTQVGSYEQIGRHVTARFQIVTSGLGGATGSLTLTGLPVTVANAAGDPGSCMVTNMTGVTLDASYTFVAPAPVINTTTALIQETGSGVSSQTIGAARIVAVTTLVGFCEYHS